MTWYKDWFGEDYLKVYPHRDEVEAKKQVDFVAKVLDLKLAQQILDLGCGNGRHANELSGKGYHVTCLDLSSVLVSLAKEKYGSASCCIRFVRADMRHIPFANAFDSVVSFFTTFGYFKTDAENLQTLKSIQAALKPGGSFFQDYLNKEYVVENLVPRDSRQVNGFEIIQERQYNRTAERIEKKITLKENGEAREYFESVRLYTLEEMKSLLAKTRLKLEKTFGDFDGSSFNSKSPRLLLVGKKEPSN
ncbi:methyltransferase domain-containing protein [candidate division KSB1 bacterium]|nr:methyltransferase domain-containing protein [candidate division KSB1 bacterium]